MSFIKDEARLHAAVRGTVARLYRDLIKELDLNEGEAGALLDRLTTHQMHVMAEAQKSARTKQRVSLSSANLELDAALRAFLGDEKFAKFKLYQAKIKQSLVSH